MTSPTPRRTRLDPIGALKAGVQGACRSLLEAVERQARHHRHKQSLRSGILVVGRHTYGTPKVDVYPGSEARVVIGKFCSISEGVRLVTGGIHPGEWVTTYPFRIFWKISGAFQDGTPRTDGEITIGSDVWLGTEAMILSGVTIGHGAIIAARAVVTRDVPPYAVVAGVPARVVRYRFTPEKIRRLLAIRWWDWDDGEILAAIPLLCSSRIEAFLEQYGQASR